MSGVGIQECIVVYGNRYGGREVLLLVARWVACGGG